MASMKVKSVNGVTARAKKKKKFAKVDIKQNNAKAKNRTISSAQVWERRAIDGPRVMIVLLIVQKGICQKRSKGQNKS